MTCSLFCAKFRCHALRAEPAAEERADDANDDVGDPACQCAEEEPCKNIHVSPV